MDALILSCSTGGGHNAAGRAVLQELQKRGHNAIMLDPYQLAGKELDKIVAGGYVKLVQLSPKLFGAVYSLGNGYRKLPIHSPVYAANKLMLKKMRAFLNENHFDVIIMPHLYPAEILTYMKVKNYKVPKTIFVATDYVCIPFTEEVDCDKYVIPHKSLESDFVNRGIPCDKLVPLGIPVKSQFLKDVSKEEAAKELGLSSDRKYYLLSGGSMGAGNIDAVIKQLLKSFCYPGHESIIVICGNNSKLYSRLMKKYGSDERVILITSTDKMELYMKASFACISKPGGLSSTEAAVSGTPLIHINPIPGCESHNMSFFEKHGMCIAVGNKVSALGNAVKMLNNTEYAEKMRENQFMYTNKNAASDICNLAEELAE